MCNCGEQYIKVIKDDPRNGGMDTYYCDLCKYSF